MKGAIYVDDSGNPGTESGSDFLSSSRKSWTAVIVPDRVAGHVDTAMGIFLAGVQQEFGADELHFMEIYGGRGVWKNVPPEKRIDVFDHMRMIVEGFQLPIIHQTVSEETIADHHQTFSNMKKAERAWWNIKDIAHFGFLLLCSQISRHLKDFKEDSPSNFSLPFPIFVDEGIAKNGADIALPNWGDAIEGPVARFRNSKDVPGIQIADFVAFAIARSQWIMVHQKLGETPKESDLRFLKLTSGFNVLNLPMLQFSPENLSKDAYEFALSRNRRNKGLTPRPKR
jgi:hypothetical protein